MGGGDARVVDDERNFETRLVVECFTAEAKFAVHDAVVGGEHDDGVLGHAEAFEGGADGTDKLIDTGDGLGLADFEILHGVGLVDFVVTGLSILSIQHVGGKLG